MIEKKDLHQVRRHITSCIGFKVRLETAKRHNKSVVKEGILSNTYPSIFTIELDEGSDMPRTVSCSYTDILTNSVELTICE